MILGIDISTSRIGYSIIDYTTKLILCQEIKLKSSELGSINSGFKFNSGDFLAII